MTINVSVQFNGGLLPDPRFLPSGNPFKCHVLSVEVLSLQSIKQYIITTLFDGVLGLYCFCFCLVFLRGD